MEVINQQQYYNALNKISMMGVIPNLDGASVDESSKQEDEEEEEEDHQFWDFDFGELTSEQSSQQTMMVTPISMKFVQEFSSCYNLAANKNLRCFPSCCKQGHLEKSFCGTKIEVSADNVVPFNVEKSFLVGEFTAAERGASMTLGQKFDPKLQQNLGGKFVLGSFSHYISSSLDSSSSVTNNNSANTGTNNITTNNSSSQQAIFTIRPPRKWQINIPSCKVKKFSLVVYLIVDKQVRSVLRSSIFEVKCRKQKRRPKVLNSSSTTTDPLLKKLVVQSAEKNVEDDNDEEEDQKQQQQQYLISTEPSNINLLNDFSCESPIFSSLPFDDDLLKFLEFSDVEQ